MRRSPGLRLTRNSPRCSFWVSSSQARRERTTLLRFLSSSMILASMLLADVGLQVADAAQLDERGGQEAAQADVDDEAALHDLDDRSLRRRRRHSLIFSMVPQARSYWARFLDRTSRPSLSSFCRTSASTCSPTADDLVGVDVVADGELADGDDALGLVADVEQDLVPVDLDDGALDDVAVVELHDGGVDGVVEGGAAQVVLDDGPGDVASRSRQRCPSGHWT